MAGAVGGTGSSPQVLRHELQPCQKLRPLQAGWGCGELPEESLPGGCDPVSSPWKSPRPGGGWVGTQLPLFRACRLRHAGGSGTLRGALVAALLGLLPGNFWS